MRDKQLQLNCFKAYDLRGRVPEELNDDVAYRVGRAFALQVRPRNVVVGHDIRLSGPRLTSALARGLTEGGADVIHIGQCGTEEIYFATSDLEVDGGICVTASHNPMGYNGMKFVSRGSRPISGDTGLRQIRTLAEQGNFPETTAGCLHHQDNRDRYINHLLGYVDRDKLPPLRIVVNAGNGGAGPIIDCLEPHLPFTFIKVHHHPDGNFPNGVPNPLLPENRASTAAAIRNTGADLGIAWDGDFDRCFFFDEQANFIEGYYLVGLLAQMFLARNPGARIIHDPRLTWNTLAMVAAAGGEAVMSKTGHAFIKQAMREVDAVYGGEMSAHHYFRDFAYCDSGMIPWLLLTALMGREQKTLSQLVTERMAEFPCSGEINRSVDDPAAILNCIEKQYESAAIGKDHTDGLSMEFADWRFNLRMSNTEPVIRLNVESRGDPALMQEKTRELLNLVDPKSV